ncbi:MAG: hypothetical protein ACR2P2_00525 [Nakamurella sp.]
MRLPVRPLRDRWPSWLESRASRFFWPDPRVLVDEDPDPAQFRKVMSQVYIGGTIKITGTNRHPEVDDLLIRNVELSGAAIADIGASDGSTSLDLIGKLEDFSSFTIADLHMSMTAVLTQRGLAFFDPDGTCVMISGRRSLAWPDQSAWVRRLYTRTIKTAASQRTSHGIDVLLLNPEVRKLMSTDSRVTAKVHDVFAVWPDPKPDVIKVANLLRRLYFPDEKLKDGLRALTASVPEGGHLLIVDNPRTADPTPRGGLYRRESGRLVVAAETAREPELADLIGEICIETSG